MQEAVLKPLGMRESTFAHPLPADKASITAAGHFPKQIVPRRWHTYAEMAAAGLWTTASDLANKGLGPLIFTKRDSLPAFATDNAETRPQQMCHR